MSGTALTLALLTLLVAAGTLLTQEVVRHWLATKLLEARVKTRYALGSWTLRRRRRGFDYAEHVQDVRTDVFAEEQKLPFFKYARAKYLSERAPYPRDDLYTASHFGVTVSEFRRLPEDEQAACKEHVMESLFNPSSFRKAVKESFTKWSLWDRAYQEQIENEQEKARPPRHPQDA